MRKKISIILLLSLVLFFLVNVSLISAVDLNSVNEFTLLAVSHQEDGSFKGGTAKLFLTIKKGSGSVFIESFPTAKIDTQVATNLGNEIACEFSKIDCSKYDFFYTIRADSPLIGGPSAGGATAVLTLASLEDIKLRDDVAMTGSITSGGIIGPVAGIFEKVNSAELKGNTVAIIPFTSILKNNSLDLNLSKSNFISLEEFENNSINIYPVMNIKEALNLASVNPKHNPSNIIAIPDEEYITQMNKTSVILCDRTEELMSDINEEQKNSSLFFNAEKFYNKSLNASSDSKFYPKASFCFTANINLRELLLEDKDQEFLSYNLERLNTSINNFEQQINTVELETFSDIETYAIVKERLLESKQYIDNINKSNVSSVLLASSIERYYSAVAWSDFFNLPGKKLIIDDNSLELACVQEIQNVESRMNYLKTFLHESYLINQKESLSHAYNYAKDDEFALCLFKASKTKADVNLYLSSISIQNDSISDIIDAKLERSAELIEEQKKEGIFPILGFSYYEYAPLVEDEITSLLFAEYALAMSDLQDYFPKKTRLSFDLRIVDIFIFVSGIFVGLFIMFLFTRKNKNENIKNIKQAKQKSNKNQNKHEHKKHQNKQIRKNKTTKQTRIEHK